MDIEEIRKKYNTLIEDFVNELNMGYGRYIKENQNKYNFILKRVEDFYFITNYISSQKLEANDEEKILFTIYSKASLNLYGVFRCLSFGLELEAGIILRSLYETYVTMELIKEKDSAERLKLFANFVHIERWDHFMKHKKLNQAYFDESFGKDKSKLEAAENMYEKYKENYHSTKPYSWAWKIFNKQLEGRNPTFKDICIHLGEKFEEEYLSLYGTFSKSIHGSAILEDYYRAEGEKDSIILNSPKYTNSQINLGVLAITYCSDVIINVISYLKIKDFEEIIEYIQLFVRETVDLGTRHTK